MTVASSSKAPPMSCSPPEAGSHNSPAGLPRAPVRPRISSWLFCSNFPANRENNRGESTVLVSEGLQPLIPQALEDFSSNSEQGANRDVTGNEQGKTSTDPFQFPGPRRILPPRSRHPFPACPSLPSPRPCSPSST